MHRSLILVAPSSYPTTCTVLDRLFPGSLLEDAMLFAETNQAFHTTLVIEPESSLSVIILFLWLSFLGAEKSL